MNDVINLILTSAFVSAATTALMNYFISERKIQIENTTQERTKWRIKIREISDRVFVAITNKDQQSSRKLAYELNIYLNPLDGEDKKIVSLLASYTPEKDSDILLNEYSKRISLLLKHDWERAKNEATRFCMRKQIKRIGIDEIDLAAQPTAIFFVPKLSIAVWFVLLMLFAGAVFFIAANLNNSFTTLVQLFNDAKVAKTWIDWLRFGTLSLLVGLLWAPFYLGFKAAEKNLVEFISKTIGNSIK